MVQNRLAEAAVCEMEEQGMRKSERTTCTKYLFAVKGVAAATVGEAA